MKIQWEGEYPALTTKFKANEELDIPAFVHHIEAQIEAGAQGIILGGSLGEASTLEMDEKKFLVKTALQTCAGRIPVIANIAESRTVHAVNFAKACEDLGMNGFMLLPPMRYLADEHETMTFFKAVAKATTLPIMIYNNPVDYKIEVTLQMFEELLQMDNIQAVKESTRDISNVTRMKNAFGDRLKILCGVDTLAFESLVAGADGWVGGLVCAFPEETMAIYQLVKANRLEEAREIHRWFMPLLELDIHSKLVQYIKLAEVATGLGTEYVRAPRLVLSGDEKQEVLNIIKKGLANRPDLSKYALEPLSI